MYSIIIKNRAIKLRSHGNTYSDINKALNMRITKATFYEWFKSLTLTESNSIKLQNNIATKLHRAQLKAFKVNKLNRQIYLKNIKDKNIPLLNKLDLSTQKLLLSILYLGEGAKHKTHPCLSLGSSDPKIILFYF